MIRKCSNQPAPQTPAPQPQAPEPRLPDPRAQTPAPQPRAPVQGQAQAQAQAPVQQQTQPPLVQVRTPVGDLTLRTPLPLPEGARVAFEITGSTANQVTVRFATLNGQPIQQALVQLAADRAATSPQPGTALPPASGILAQTNPLSFGQVWTPGGPVAINQAGFLNAFVLAGNATVLQIPGQAGANAGQSTPTTPGQPTGQAAAQPQTGLLTGSDLTVRIASVNAAAAGTAPPQGVTTGQLTGGGNPASTSPAGQPTPGTAAS